MGHMEKDLADGGRLCLTGTVITLYNDMGQSVRRWSYEDAFQARMTFMRLVDEM